MIGINNEIINEELIKPPIGSKIKVPEDIDNNCIFPDFGKK